MSLIFLPGWGFHATVWEPCAKQLTGHDIHYADLPLIENNNENLNSITAKLNDTLPEDSTLIAWSLGGLFAIALCAAYPDKYKKLILVASTPKFVEDADWKGISQTQANTFLIEAERNLPHLIKHFHRLICYPSKESSLRTHLQNHAVTHEPSLRFYLKLLFDTDLRQEFKTLQQPILQIAAEKDAIVTVNSPDHIVPDTGHATLSSRKILSAFCERFVRDPFRTNLFPQASQTFNRAAHTYDQHASLQHHVGKKLISLLPNNTFTHVIDLGCGTGATTEQLALSINYKKFHALDAAPNLLQLATARLKPHSINTFEASFDLPLPLQKKFDLIFSNMALHWSQCFSQTLNHVFEALSDEGLIAFTVPLDGTFNELKNVYSVNSQPSIDNIITFLKESNFDIIYPTQETHTFYFDNTLETLRSIRHVGATYVKHRNQKSLSGRKKLLSKPITQLTYEIGYFIAKRAPKA